MNCNQIVLVYTKLSQNALSFRNTIYYICPFPNRLKRMEKWRLVLKYHELHKNVNILATFGQIMSVLMKQTSKCTCNSTFS